MYYKIKNEHEWICKYCGQKFKRRKDLYNHYKTCEEKAKLPKDSLGRIKNNNWEKRRKTINDLVIAGKYKYKSHKQSEESKRKIGEKRRKAIKEGRGNHWISPHINKSYAEQYFFEIFTNNNITFENNYSVYPYTLDFAFLQNKTYIEIDGEQHYTKEGITHDKERTEYLNSIGWKCIKRIRWKEYNKLKYNEKEIIIKNLLSIICPDDEIGKHV